MNETTFTDCTYHCPVLGESLNKVLKEFPNVKIHVTGREHNDDYNVVVTRKHGKWRHDAQIDSFLDVFGGYYTPKKEDNLTPIFHFVDGLVLSKGA